MTEDLMRAAKRNAHRMLALCGFETVRENSRIKLRKRFFLGSDYLKDIRKIVGGARNVRACVDGGAHRGETALDLAAAFPRATIYSFEPEKNNFKRLMETVSSCKRIVPIPMALGAVTTTGTFIANEDSQTGSMLDAAPESGKYVLDPGMMRPVSKDTVRIVALSDWATANKVDAIELLKLDLQGYELKALEGSKSLLSSKNILFIYLEVNFTPAYEGQATLAELYEFCTSMGYRLVGLYPNEFNAHQFHYRCGGDLLFVLEDLNAFGKKR